MTRVLIGIHVYEDPQRLLATIASVRAHTRAADLLLLPDGPDAATIAALESLGELPQSATADPRGAPAAFNRLASADAADVVVLLESGCLVAPGWLDALVAALEDPRHGLAGPTTNASWNEQGALPRTGPNAEEIARAAVEAVTRFGRDVRGLEPLHSLADFCYAVRRDVIRAIGRADEAYGLGPCWEMDYNIRAARAGFRGVWATAAYVHRAAWSRRRAIEEPRGFEASKRRYQDKFCGQRLQALTSDYRTHCRGDACPNFAPVSLIAIRDTTGARPAMPAIESPPPRPVAIDVRDRDPLVTCIMPTANRRAFIGQSVRCFLRQDYAALELLVVDDGADAVADCLPDDPRIRYIRLDRQLPLGAKRNLACSHARGDIIVHWDDDDWYPASRVGTQVRALVDRGVDICGTSRLFYYEPATDRAWEYRYQPGQARWVAGNTLAYRKRVWQRTPFQDVQVGEDALFVWHSGASLCDLSAPGLCVGMIHGGNVSPKDTGGLYWHAQSAADVHALVADDIHFYRTMPPSPAGSTPWPLVSCIMPTYNRRSFVTLALELFRRQDYPHRELIVVDDGERGVRDLVEGAPDVRYFSFGTRRTIGAKRNFACEQARGEIIAHWDDDDWYAPERLRYQVSPLLAGQADITGLENAWVLEPADGRFWTMQRELHRQMFLGDVHGGTLVFRKQLLTGGVRYPDVDLAEDAWLLHTAIQQGRRLLRLSNPGVFVYMRHGRNAWKDCVPGRFLNPSAWERTERPPMFPARALSSYQAATATM